MTVDEETSLLLRAETAEALLQDAREEMENLRAEIEDLKEQLAGKPKPEEPKGNRLMDPKEAEKRIAREMARVLFDGDQWKFEELGRLGKRERFDVMYGGVPHRLPPLRHWHVEIKRSVEFDCVHITARHPTNKGHDWNMVVDGHELMMMESHHYTAERFADGCARRNALMTHEKEHLRDCVRYELDKFFKQEGRW